MVRRKLFQIRLESKGGSGMGNPSYEYLCAYTSFNKIKKRNISIGLLEPVGRPLEIKCDYMGRKNERTISESNIICITNRVIEDNHKSNANCFMHIIPYSNQNIVAWVQLYYSPELPK